MRPFRNLFSPVALLAGVVTWFVVASLQKPKPPRPEPADEMAGPLGV